MERRGGILGGAELWGQAQGHSGDSGAGCALGRAGVQVQGVQVVGGLEGVFVLVF